MDVIFQLMQAHILPKIKKKNEAHSFTLFRFVEISAVDCSEDDRLL